MIKFWRIVLGIFAVLAVTQPSAAETPVDNFFKRICANDKTTPSCVAPSADQEVSSDSLLGVRVVPVTKEIAGSLDMEPPRGMLVVAVEDGGPAKSAGIEMGDVILMMDGKDIAQPSDLSRGVSEALGKNEVAIIVLNRGREQTRTVTFARDLGSRGGHQSNRSQHR